MGPSASARRDPGLAGAALVAVAIWGGSPAATKLALEALPPVDVALLRTLLGCLLALPLALLLRLPLPRGGRQWRLLGLSAGCGFLLFPLLFSFGQIRTSATHATLVLAFLPVLTAVYALAWDRRTPSPRLVAGCLVALAGEAGLALSRDPWAAPGEATLVGDLLVLASGCASAFGYVAGARLAREGYPSAAVTYWGVVLASTVLLPVVPGLVGRLAAAPGTARAWAGLLYLGLGSTVLAYILWYGALARGGIARMGLTQFLQPVAGLVLAVLLVGETVGAPVLLAGVVILLGTALARGGAR